MDELVPQQLRIAAIVHIVSGVLSFFGACVGSMVIGSLCGLLTCGMGGQFLGILSYLLIPLGLVEIGVGAFALLNPKDASGVMRIMSFVEMGAILLGGITNAVAGVAVYMLLQNEEVVGYLEG